MSQHNNEGAIENLKKLNKLSFSQKLFGYFGAQIKPDTDRKNANMIQDISYSIAPGKQYTPDKLVDKKDSELLDEIMGQLPLSQGVKELYDEWAKDVQIGYDNFKERLERVNALTFLYCNDSYIKSSSNLTAMETSKSAGSEVFTVSSDDPEWDERTNNLINKVWNTTHATLYDIALQLYLYADSFIGNEVNSAGIVKREVLRITDVIEKLEFDPLHVAAFVNEMKAQKGGGFSVNYQGFNTSSNFNVTGMGTQIYSSQAGYVPGGNTTVEYQSRSDLLKNYLKNLSEVSAEEFFTKHLLGYRITGDRFLAPWQISHIRYGESSSEFYPYGCPLLLPCVSLHLQEQRVNGLEDIRKRLNLPLTTWEVETGSETMSRAFQLVNNTKQRYENMGLTQQQGTDFPNLINNVWTAKGLLEIKKQGGGDSGTSEGTIEELRRLDDKKVTCTLVPKTYVDPNSEGFQMSGVALMQLFAPYRDLVESLRDLITQDYEEAIQLHYAILGEEVPEHTLTLNVINPTDDQALSQKLDLADKVLEKVADALGVEKEKMTQEIKLDILQRFGGLDPIEIEKWKNLFNNKGPEKNEAEVSEEDLNSGFGDEGSGDFDMGDDMGGDVGGDEDMGGDEGMEESVASKERRLLEDTYRAIREDEQASRSLLLEVMSSIRKLETTKGITRYYEGNSLVTNNYKDAIQFFGTKKAKRMLNERRKIETSKRAKLDN